MKLSTKLIAIVGILPVLGDFIEDLNDEKIFTKAIKMRANHLLDEIRKSDKRLLDDANQEIWEQQMDIQLAFRQWLQNAEDEQTR
tara:strand:+ start:857 stop:1111 length:255 start_codon:yes stop_codon:yes gene_type:complete